MEGVVIQQVEVLPEELRISLNSCGYSRRQFDAFTAEEQHRDERNGRMEAVRRAGR